MINFHLHQIAGLKKIAGVLIWVIKATPLTTVVLNLQFDASKENSAFEPRGSHGAAKLIQSP